MEKIRYGVIGLSMGAYHAKGVAAQVESELAAVYDPNPEAVAAVVRDSHPLRVAESWQEIALADDIDVVVVCTPDQLHEEMTISALEHGKHVLCEKPMALTREACAHMIAAAEATGKKLMVGQVCRYAPAFAKAKELIDAGEIGELYYVESEYAHDYLKVRGANDWRVDPMRYGLLGGGCHAMDLLSWIAGRPNEVFAYSNHKMLKDWPTDDTTIAVLKYPGDVIGKVFCSISCKRDYTMRSLFYGSKGTIICDNTSPEMTIFDENHAPRELPIDINNHNVFAEISEMTAAIRENRQPSTTGYDGADTVSICLSAVESTKSGLPVKIPYLR